VGQTDEVPDRSDNAPQVSDCHVRSVQNDAQMDVDVVQRHGVFVLLAHKQVGRLTRVAARDQYLHNLYGEC